MKKASTARGIAKLIAGVVLLFGGYVAWLIHDTLSSAMRAEDLCNGFKLGLPEAKVIEGINSARGARLQRYPDMLEAKFGSCSCYVAIAAKGQTVEKAVSGCRE
ncbi:hypothetical protein [Hydrocarboniphaga daqingensis]|uniref:hypothetical protein n=1 Tax=Hydrocarboniphaga daqingensis TaxID=490188 RepID=UPI001114C7B7|nr:hypothetical protein [Hydrocarboniphaga daqingensis]